jgi:carbon-monoxide dehydrogenase iron sulfur subunit
LHCPENALTLGPWGQIIASPTVCTLCLACEKACPIGAIEVFDGIVYVCDLCDGKPKCVEACTEGAITFVDGKERRPSLAEIKKKTKTMSTSQKRQFYLKTRSGELREKWSRKYA